jgi:hypothetical protein
MMECKMEVLEDEPETSWTWLDMSNVKYKVVEAVFIRDLTENLNTAYPLEPITEDERIELTNYGYIVNLALSTEHYGSGPECNTADTDQQQQQQGPKTYGPAESQGIGINEKVSKG